MSYSKRDHFAQRGLDEARSKELDMSKHFNAGYNYRGEQLKELLSEGRNLAPTRWADVAKAEARRRPDDKCIPPEFKPRLDARGDFWRT